MTASKILAIADSLRAASHHTRLPHPTRRAEQGSQALRDRIAAADGLIAAGWSGPR